MRANLKRMTALTLMMLLPFATFAQNSFMQEAKGIVNEYVLPIILIGVIVAAGAGLLFNLDDFVDKNGQGTRSKALVNIGWIVGVAFVGILALIAIINFIANRQIQIS